MPTPQKVVYRVCPVCSSPIPLNNDHCRNCGHSLLQSPVDKEADQILRGKVFYNGQWVLMDEKAKHEKFIEEQLAAGKVEINGQWVKIEEKVKIHRETTSINTSKVVDFPVKPLDTAPAENEKNGNPTDTTLSSPVMEGKHQSHRFIIIIFLSIVSFLTMAVAAVGIISKIFPKFWLFN